MQSRGIDTRMGRRGVGSVRGSDAIRLAFVATPCQESGSAPANVVAHPAFQALRARPLSVDWIVQSGIHPGSPLYPQLGTFFIGSDIARAGNESVDSRAPLIWEKNR